MNKTRQKTPYHHGDVLPALLKAGLEHIEALSPDQISLQALAREIGVSQSAPYRHVSSREAFLALLAAQGFALLVEERDRLVCAAPVVDRLEAACRAYAAFAMKRPGLYRLMFQSGLLGAENAYEDLERWARHSFDTLVELVAGDGRFVDPLATAAFIWSSLHGAILIRHAGLMPFDSASQSTGGEMVDNLFRHLVGGAGR